MSIFKRKSSHSKTPQASLTPQASFYFRDKAQRKQWKQYLLEVDETQQQAIWSLMDLAIKHNQDLNEYLEDAEQYMSEKMR